MRPGAKALRWKNRRYEPRIAKRLIWAGLLMWETAPPHTDFYGDGNVPYSIVQYGTHELHVDAESLKWGCYG